MLLLLLEHYGVTAAMLKRKYALDYTSLKKIRMGEDLPRAHRTYFVSMLTEAERLRTSTLHPLAEEERRAMKDLLYLLMLHEVTSV